MIHTKLLLSLAICLGSIGPAVADPANGWEAAFWSGAKCTSEGTGTYQKGKGFKKGQKFCHGIPDIGVTQAVDFYAKDSSYKFGLHRRDDCSDSPSQYLGNPDQPVCIETNDIGGSVAFSVKHTRSSRRSVDESEDLLEERNAVPEDDAVLAAEARDFVDSYTVSTLAASGGFGITAVQSCPVRYNNNPANGWRQNTVCCISATGFAFFAFLSVWHNTGETEESNGGKRNVDGPWYETLNPHSDFGVLEAVQPLGQTMDKEGTQWDQYLYNVTEHRTGLRHHLIYEHDVSYGRHILSADQDTTRMGLENGGLNKRQSASTYRAYYAWKNLRHKPFKARGTGNAEVGHLVEQAWNFCRGNDQDVVCANFRVKGKGQIALGQYSVTNGVFSPDFSSC
ncbi:uncharacterized protein LTR77_004386 [Saxophila tyrrhenica]|uniref:Uncharacterized protein n=1 Tax=Saxophila tyrrhenica TaxID=1690608 RepID=A0AAV9PCM6_9PEZI|nr:hypothetical protein LTR77_004386 [Saxophila tyrrhenica]